ncbi:uncharacterized protein [Temnothorax nylanderi]|uniref:uncharacterized protein n=1 Tax=Temnothorax nylanderi TaxID=102681 RepID=UPI003A8BAC6B
MTSNRTPTDLTLYAANGSPIPTFGQKLVSVDLGLRRKFEWRFTVAKVTHAIIGADFLAQFNLLVDLHNRRLIDGVTKLGTNGQIINVTTPSVSTILQDNEYSDLLKEFIDITRPCQHKKPKHKVQHFITTRGPPVAARARRLSPEKLRAARAEFAQMIVEGICQPSSSSWASPLHLVRKKTGEWRYCGDYRGVNST